MTEKTPGQAAREMAKARGGMFIAAISWDVLPESVRHGWEAVAQAAIDARIAASADGTLSAAQRVIDLLDRDRRVSAERDRLRNALSIIGQMIPVGRHASPDECRQIGEVVWGVLHREDTGLESPGIVTAGTEHLAAQLAENARTEG